MKMNKGDLTNKKMILHPSTTFIKVMLSLKKQVSYFKSLYSFKNKYTLG